MKGVNNINKRFLDSNIKKEKKKWKISSQYDTNQLAVTKCL